MLFVMKESAYLLNFGYQGIMSTIDALVTRNDIVYDVDAHACIDYVLVEKIYLQTQ
jgi:glycine C-acetyltransferase